MRQALLCLASALASVYAVNVVSITSFTATNNGFLNIIPVDSTGQLALVISEFTGNPLAADGVSIADNINAQNLTALQLRSATSSITWPNEVVPVADNIIAGSPAAMLVGAGFLVPPKTVGGVWHLTSDGQGVKLSKDKGGLLDGWFYHRPLLRDVNGDGLVDILAPRATKPLFGTPGGELIALLQPASNPLSTTPWQELLIFNGSYAPDVFSRLTSLRGDTDPDEQLVFTTFFSGSGISMIICPGCGPGTPSASRNTWSNVSSLQHIILDTTIGPSFDVEVVDLNADGRLDLLVTNHVGNSSLSGVFGYETPLPPLPLSNAAAWTRHTLASGFVTREPGLPGTQASPGAARSFFPCAATSQQAKPSVSVAGDGDQRAYLLSPVSADPTDWTYNLTEIWDCKGTVGQQAAFPISAANVAALPAAQQAAGAAALAAGCQVLFVPCYDDSTVEVLLFTP